MFTQRKVLVTLVGATLLIVACRRSSSPPTPSDRVDVGYGTQPKEKVTGAVTALSGDEVAATPLRIEELLRGKVAGLQIIQGRNGVTFRIRGTNSMLADQEPLIVVDGVQISSESLGSALAGLTRDDIKSVTVLKDVSSTSIYGSRGAGGVILIATKK